MARASALDALRPTNSIEAIQAPALPLPNAPKLPSVPTSAPLSAPSAAATAKKPGPHTTESAAIASSYYVEDRGRDRHFYDDYQRKALVMRVTDSVVSSKRQDLNTIKAMFEVAGTRSWTSVDLKGTAEFKREAWIEAQVRGVDARGYRATDLDRQEAERRGRERGQSNEVRAAAATPTPVADKPGQPAVQGTAQTKAAGTAAPSQEETPSVASHRKTYRTAKADLSPDGRVVLSALSETIDRQMMAQTSLAKAEIKAYVATELAKKERVEGPVVLSADQKRAATALEPSRTPTPAELAKTRRIEPDAPRRSLSR